MLFIFSLSQLFYKFVEIGKCYIRHCIDLFQATNGTQLDNIFYVDIKAHYYKINGFIDTAKKFVSNKKSSSSFFRQTFPGHLVFWFCIFKFFKIL